MHISVLLNETINGLDLKKGETVVDATFGLGGHSKKACTLVPDLNIIAIDLNGDTLYDAARSVEQMNCRVTPVKDDFKNILEICRQLRIEQVDKFIFDLGWSSVELEESGRGFSFKRDEPLVMTYQDQPGEDVLTAYDVVNEWEESSIAAIIEGYGEERFAKKIAKRIVEVRKIQPIRTTFQLVEAIKPAFPRRLQTGKIHFATKTFQAIRIAVNDELEGLKVGLRDSFQILKKGGRIAVITFHSLEDRIVKNFFRDLQKGGFGQILTKKPIVPGQEEIISNPRARSAKLRIIEKC